MFRQIPLCVALVVGAAPLAIYAADAPNAPAKQAPSVSHRDKTFVETATEAGAAEVLDAELIISKTANPDVKDFAQGMKTDHAQANKQLADLAQSKNIIAPTDTTHKQTKIYDKLTKLDGAELDKTYINDQVKVHEDAVKLFQKEADKGDDSDIKAFAGTTLPTLQHHLQMAKDLQSKLSGTVSDNK